MLTIHDRPFLPRDRSETGHWAGGLIISDSHLSAIGTLAERRTWMLRLAYLPRSDGDSWHAARHGAHARPAAHADAVHHLGRGDLDGVPPRHHRQARAPGYSATPALQVHIARWSPFDVVAAQPHARVATRGTVN